MNFLFRRLRLSQHWRILWIAGRRSRLPETGQLTELLEYLDFYLEAGGCITLDQTELGQEDAVQFMSAHGSKGLEFPHLFIIRAISGSFPTTFKETLFDFPQELRDPLTAAEGDPKEVHQQEERRLFYVAMTRARDTLAIYAKKGRGKKDSTPPGFVRELLHAKSVADTLQHREAEFRPTDRSCSCATGICAGRLVRDAATLTVAETYVERHASRDL